MTLKEGSTKFDLQISVSFWGMPGKFHKKLYFRKKNYSFMSDPNMT